MFGVHVHECVPICMSYILMYVYVCMVAVYRFLYNVLSVVDTDRRSGWNCVIYAAVVIL